MSNIYDVIVIGAGPAGGAAAYFLGEAGKRVLVLEKERLPRYKPCGGGLSIAFLERQFPFSFAPVMQSKIKGLSYAFDGRIETIPVKPDMIGMVMRDQFDDFLLAHVKAEIRQEVPVRKVIESSERVTVETQNGERIESRYLIGADGANSVVARSLGLRRNRTLAAAIEAEVPASPQVLQRFADLPVFIFGQIHQGYLWIFPKADHLSVGVAAYRPLRGELQATLQRVMAAYGIPLGDIPLYGHPIPIYTRKEPLATPRTLLVGDAAGLADPLSGEGIRYAIKSGGLAAETILSGHPERYPQLIFRDIGLNHLFALQVAKFFYRFQHLCLTLGAPNPFTTSAIVNMLSDRAGTADIMLRSIFTLPFYLFTESLAWLVGKIVGPQGREKIRSSLKN